jgi:hypothetical protein
VGRRKIRDGIKWGKAGREDLGRHTLSRLLAIGWSRDLRAVVKPSSVTKTRLSLGTIV